MATRQVNAGRLDRFRPLLDAEEDWCVWDDDYQEFAAGPYATEVQAIYVAAALSADPKCCPYAPDGATDSER